MSVRKSTATRKKRRIPLSVQRAAIVVGIVLAFIFLVEGGEWGTVDLFRQQRRLEHLRAEVAQLEREVDSLRAEYKSITTDPKRLERIARERYGMVRGSKELLYWIRDPRGTDSTR